MSGYVVYISDYPSLCINISLSVVWYALLSSFVSIWQPVCLIVSQQAFTLHKKWSFPLSISSVNVTKSVVFCRLRHINWRNPQWKNSFFVQCYIWLSVCLSVWLYIYLSVCLHVFMIVILYVCLSVFVTVFLKSFSFFCLLFRVSFSSQLFSCLLCIQVMQAYWVYKLIFYISFLGIQFCTYKFFGYTSIGYAGVYKLIVHPGYTSLLFTLLIENSNLSLPRTENPIEVLHFANRIFHCFWKTIFT